MPRNMTRKVLKKEGRDGSEDMLLHIGVEFIILFGLFFFDDVLVDIFEHVGRGMAHAAHGINIGDAQVDHDGGVIVAQVMKPEGIAQFFPGNDKMLGQIIGIELENPVRRGRIRWFQAQKMGFQFRWDGDGSGSCRCFRGFDHPFIFLVIGHGFADMEHMIIEIGPCQGADFPSAEAKNGRNSYCKLHIRGFFQIFHQFFDLGIGGDGGFSLLLFRQFYADMDFRRGFRDGRNQEGVDVSDGLWRVVSSYFVDEFLNHVIGQIAYFPPADGFIAAFKETDISTDGSWGENVCLIFDVFLDGFADGHGAGGFLPMGDIVLGGKQFRFFFCWRGKGFIVRRAVRFLSYIDTNAVTSAGKFFRGCHDDFPPFWRKINRSRCKLLCYDLSR